MAIKLGGSVGLNGKNNKMDVLLVQQLLNGVAPSMGGPPSPIAVDGLVGPETIGAIRRFQMANFKTDDGRVDPNGQTIVKLGGGSATTASAGGKPAGAVGGLPGTIDSSNLTSRPPDALAMIVSAQGLVLIDAPGAQGPAFPGQQFPCVGVVQTFQNSSCFVQFFPSKRIVHMPASAIFFLDQEGPILTQGGPTPPAAKPAPYYQVGKTQPKPAPYYKVGNGNPTGPATPPAQYYQVGKSSGQKPAPYYQVGR